MPTVTAVAADVSGFIMSVETATVGVFQEVFGVDKFSRKGTRNTTKRATFGSGTPTSRELESVGLLDETITLSGVLSINDPGQTILRLAAQAGTLINLQFTMDGINGYSRHFKLSDDSSDLSADSDLGDFSMSAIPKSDFTLVGTTGIYF